MDIPEKTGTGYLLADKNACSIIILAGKPIVRIVEKPLKSTISIVSREAAASIQYLDLGNERKTDELLLSLPVLRQSGAGVDLPAHKCKNISWNQYKVCYQANTGGASYNGYMDDSIHMYNDAIVYEGKTVTPVTHLTENNYSRTDICSRAGTQSQMVQDRLADKATIENLRQAD